MLLSFKGMCNCSLHMVEQNTTVMSLALNSIAKKLFLGKYSHVRIVCSASHEMRMKTYDIVSDLTAQFGSGIKVTIEEPEVIKDSRSKRLGPMIIFISSKESFERIKNKLLFNNIRFCKFYLLVFVNGTFVEVDKVMRTFWSNFMHNINILSEESDGTVGTYTFFPFADGSCGLEVSLKLFNQFDPKRNAWSEEIFFPEKFNNLNLCPLKVAALGWSLPSVITTITANGGIKFSGFEVDIIVAIAEELNCTLQFKHIATTGILYENGSSTPGLLSSLRSGECELGIGSISLQYERTLFLTETSSFMSVPIVMMIPPAKKVSPFRKLSKPFSALVWIMLLSTLIIGVFIILVLRMTSRSAYNFVIGQGVKNPFMNMILAVTGTSLHTLPKKNFSRFLLMNFLLFCLVFRSLYQGKLYIMMSMDLHEKEFSTIDDIMSTNMIFYTYESMMRRIQGQKIASRFETFDCIMHFNTLNLF